MHIVGLGRHMVGHFSSIYVLEATAGCMPIMVFVYYGVLYIVCKAMKKPFYRNK